MGTFARVAALSSIVALLGGCAITSEQRRYATYGTVGVALLGVGIYGYAAMSTCPANPTGVDHCEEERHDLKNAGGLVAIGGLAAAIIAQLWPVTDEPAERPKAAAPIVMRPPPPISDDAAKLHDPAALQLADNARVFAAAGKCMEAIGSLKALRQMDPGLADQLEAWDPTVSRCRSADALPPPAPSGPPSSTAPATPDTAPATP